MFAIKLNQLITGFEKVNNFKFKYTFMQQIKFFTIKVVLVNVQL